MRLFMETVQHIHGPMEADGIDGAIGASVMILHNLQYSGTRSLPRLRRGVFPAKLSDAQSGANTVFDRFGKRQQVPFRRSHPIQGMFAMSRPAHQVFIPVLGYHGPGGSVPQSGDLPAADFICPEPSGFWLLAGSLLAIIVRVRRRAAFGKGW